MRLDKIVTQKLNAIRHDYNKTDSMNEKRELCSFYYGYISCLLTLNKINAMEALELANVVFYPEKAEELEELNQ